MEARYLPHIHTHVQTFRQDRTPNRHNQDLRHTPRWAGTIRAACGMLNADHAPHVHAAAHLSAARPSIAAHAAANPPSIHHPNPTERLEKRDRLYSSTPPPAGGTTNNLWALFSHKGLAYRNASRDGGAGWPSKGRYIHTRWCIHAYGVSKRWSGVNQPNRKRRVTLRRPLPPT